MNMPAHKIVNLDCRGMRCPEPILAIAKATRDLRGEPGQLLISADDDAFPGDLKSWARSAQAQIVTLTPDGQLHHATIMVNTHKAAALPGPPLHAAPPQPPQDTSPLTQKKLLNCLGMKCPEQVIALAKLAKHSPPGQLIEIQADDDTFAMDLKSWARSAKAQILSMDNTPGRCIATLQLAGGPAPASATPRHTSQPAPTPTLASAPPVLPAQVLQPAQLKLDLRADSTPQKLERLVGLTQAQLPADTMIELLLSSQDALPELMSWLVQQQHQLVQVHTDALPLRLLIRTGPPTLNERIMPPPMAPLTPVISDKQDTALSPLSQERYTLMASHGDLGSLISTMLLAHAAASKSLSVEVYLRGAAIKVLRHNGAATTTQAEPDDLSAAHDASAPLRLTPFRRLSPRRLIYKRRISTLEQLFEAAIAQGIRIKVCTSSLTLIGWTPSDLMPLPNIDLVEDDPHIKKPAKLGSAL